MLPVIISIVVPVYNAERYLVECLESILHQLYPSFELILINDGSSDASGLICDEYAHKDSRVRVVHQENKGSSAARQVGFELSQGEYIVAIDADDWVDEQYLANMLQIMEREHADIVMSAYWYNRYGKDTYIANHASSDEVAVWQKDFINGTCHAGLWNKMLRKDILLSGKIIVPQHSYFEDMAITISYIEQCKKLCYNPSATYHYRYNNDSLTNTPNKEKRIVRLYEMVHNMADLCQSLPKEKQHILRTDIEIRMAGERWGVLNLFPEAYVTHKDIFTYFIPLEFPLKKVKGFSTLCRYLFLRGITFPYKLMNRYQKRPPKKY